MTKIDVKKIDLDSLIQNAQRERLILMRNGKPVALIVGIEGMDEEHLELGGSDKFWRLIEERRTQKTMTRTELEQRIKRRSQRD